MTHRIRQVAWLLLGAGLAISCGGAPEDAAADSCIPNEQVECSCPNGQLGVRECGPEGTGFGQCTGCASPVEGCSSEPDCDGCSSCFDSCVCQGGNAKACLAGCTGSGTSSGGGGASPGGGGASASGGAPGGGGTSGGGYSGGGSGGASGNGSGGSAGGAVDCTSCVAQSCGAELSGCTQTSGCIELVQCAQASGCTLSDYGCLLFGCGAYLINVKAVPPAVSLGNCAASACAMECS